MKHIMPFFAACALLVGSACSTYTSSTDPNDTGSGTALGEEVITTAHSAEAHAPAAATTADTTSAAAPADSVTEKAAPAAEAAH
ncbi:hypothetical protein [Rufibacter radiotolerans]|nr:hypothetical protein [Rufibacter radiotolerans]